MEPVTVNFAMTREDFVHGAAARLRMQTAGTFRFSVRLAGAAMIALGCFLTVRRSVPWSAVLCAIFGAFLLFLSLPTLESAVRRRAAARFERGLCGVAAQTVSFGESGVEIRSERYEAKIPYGMLFAAYADETTILLGTAEDEKRIVPKRTMGREEQKRVESLLAEKMSQKFKQEGAREWMK